jgi:hypothetical protein
VCNWMKQIVSVSASVFINLQMYSIFITIATNENKRTNLLQPSSVQFLGVHFSP